MNCPRDDEISAFADEMLAPEARQQFALHLRGCAACSQRLETLSALRRDLHQLPSPTLGLDLAARLEQQLRQRPVRGRPQSPRWPWLGWSGPGVAAVCSIAAGVWLGGMLVGGTVAVAPPTAMLRVLGPVPPGSLCAAPELCRISKGIR
jgi:anti-sigma factor RsiW